MFSLSVALASAIFTFTGVKLDHGEFGWKITAVFYYCQVSTIYIKDRSEDDES